MRTRDQRTAFEIHNCRNLSIYSCYLQVYRHLEHVSYDSLTETNSIFIALWGKGKDMQYNQMCTENKVHNQ